MANSFVYSFIYQTFQHLLGFKYYFKFRNIKFSIKRKRIRWAESGKTWVQRNSCLMATCSSPPVPGNSSADLPSYLFLFSLTEQEREREEEEEGWDSTFQACHSLHLMRRSDSRNSAMGISVSLMHTVEAFGIFSKDPTSTPHPCPQCVSSSYCWVKNSGGPSLRPFIHSIFPNPLPDAHTLPPTQTVPFHFRKG